MFALANGRANVTDPDSRIVKTRDGWVQAFSAQAIVNKNQIVLVCEVSQDTGDVQLCQSMTTTLTQTLGAAGIHSEIELMLSRRRLLLRGRAHQPRPGPG